MTTIKYSETCVLNVKKADNCITVYLNPDSGGSNGTLFHYCTDALGEAPPNATVDMTPALGGVGGSGTLAIICGYRTHVVRRDDKSDQTLSGQGRDSRAT